MTTDGMDPNALRALAEAYDREDAAQRGEPNPWNLDDPGDIGDSDTWVSERITCAELGIAAFFAALSARSPQDAGVTVKPLEWKQVSSRRWEALPTNWKYAYVAFERFDGLWNIEGTGGYMPLCSTIEDAKAAAHADYEQRIRSALVSDPTGAAAPVTDDAQYQERKWRILAEAAEAAREKDLARLCEALGVAMDGYSSPAKLFERCIEAALSSAAGVAEGWRSVETDKPPHDVRVLLWSPPSVGWPNGQIEARVFSTGRSGDGWSEYSQHSWATHWQPLPVAPKPEGDR